MYLLRLSAWPCFTMISASCWLSSLILALKASIFAMLASRVFGIAGRNN